MTKEKVQKWSLIIASYGKGYYIYTGLSLFRELPEGVSGAYRILANIISLKEPTKIPSQKQNHNTSNMETKKQKTGKNYTSWSLMPFTF
jgi:hypothetical protein